MSLTYWISPLPHRCDVCKRGILSTFFDCRIHGRAWAAVCPECRDAHGPERLGYGAGQRYDLQADGRWLKTEG